MRAFVLTGYGAISDNVRLAEMADPVAGPGEVLIEIHAASLNPIDFKLVHGALKRISTYKLPRPFGFDERHRDIGGRRGYQIQAGRCGLYPRVARHRRYICRTDCASRKIHSPQAADNFARGSRIAAAGGADHAAGFWPRKRSCGAADP